MAKLVATLSYAAFFIVAAAWLLSAPCAVPISSTQPPPAAPKIQKPLLGPWRFATVRDRTRAVALGAAPLGNERVNFRLIVASDRPVVIAEQRALDVRAYRAAVWLAATEALWRIDLPATDWGAAHDHAWAENDFDPDMRLPKASRFVGDNRLGKLYIGGDALEKWRQIPANASDKPYMHEREREGWAHIAAASNGGGAHLDWGTGASSRFACSVYARVNAIDSVPAWCDTVKKSLGQGQRTCGAINMHCIDVGRTAQWGYPIENVTSPLYFHKYLNAVDSFPERYYDTILVDGRFRVACAIRAISKLRRDSILLIHDYSKKRESYEKVLDFFDVVARYGELIALSVKENFTDATLPNYSSFPAVYR